METAATVHVQDEELVLYVCLREAAAWLRWCLQIYHVCQNGLWVWLVHVLFDVDLNGPVGIVMGAEGAGLRRLTEEKCDFLVQIPMRGKVECLNVSVATGVCLFEALRQRGEGDSGK